MTPEEIQAWLEDNEPPFTLKTKGCRSYPITDRANVWIPAAYPAMLVDRLREARSVIDPDKVYRMQMPDGEMVEFTGREMLETSDNMLALVDAQRAGDEDAIRAAVLRIAKKLE